ncbi:MAG: DUF4240 domain-containing protein [Bacteroidota bacterium]
MTELQFWNIINQLDWKKDTDDAVVAPAIRLLSTSSVGDIFSFYDILANKLYQLDTHSHAEQIGEGSYRSDKYFSVDAFLYARACVVANGKKAFDHILRHPKDMPKDLSFEPLLNVAAKAYEMKTGEVFDYVPAINYETFSNREGWKRKAS